MRFETDSVWGSGKKKGANSSIQSSNWQYHICTTFILPHSKSFATTCYRDKNIYLHASAKVALNGGVVLMKNILHKVGPYLI